MPRLANATKKSDPQLHTSIYFQIRDAILAGELPPGSPLSRRTLAEEFQVSSLPVGFALQRLEAEGFVESRPRAGTRVKVPSANEVRGNYILREALETQAARLFAESASQAERDGLLRTAVRLDSLFEKGRTSLRGRARAEAAHVDFHGRIARATKCQELVDAIDRSRVLLFNSLFSQSLTNDGPPTRWHSQLAEVVVSRDAHAAAEAMRSHVRFRMEETVSHFASQWASFSHDRIVRQPRRPSPKR